MKKILIGIGIGLLVLVIVGVVVVGLFLGNIIKAGVETVGPKITQTTLTVNSVSVSLLGGSAGVNGLVLGNPEGYKTAQAISVGKAAVSVVPGAILADKVVIHSVELRDVEITFEGSPFGANNLSKIMDNVNALAASGKADANAPGSAGAKKPAKKLEVDDFLISGAKVHAQINAGIVNKEITLTLPDIHFSDLGKGNDGITAAELTKKVLGEITADTVKSLASAVNDLGKGATDAVKNAGKTMGDNVNKIGKGLGGLLGK